MLEEMSKSELLTKAKYELNNSPMNTEIKEGELFELLKFIVDGHYNSEELKGCGISHFFISNCNINRRNRKFNIMRADGSSVDFSYKKAISKRVPPTEQYIKRALRHTVKPFVDNFKKQFFKENADSKGYIICPISGLKTKIQHCHTDHEYPSTFDSLYYKFINDFNIDINSIQFEKSSKKDNNPVILDDKINELFYKWHAENAKLRCVYWRANLQHKKTKNFNEQAVI